jgi:hypothetical protein
MAAPRLFPLLAHFAPFFILSSTCLAQGVPGGAPGVFANPDPPVLISPQPPTAPGKVVAPIPNPASAPTPGRDDIPYTCTGTSCCDYTCAGNNNCAVSTGGLLVPDWWLRDVGFESCALRVASNYDRTIKCSQGLPPFATCGFKEKFACGYGLACVAINIATTQCIPICDAKRYPGGFRSSQLSRFFLEKVTAGCTVDGQSGTSNTNARSPVAVGEVQVCCYKFTLIQVAGTVS